MLTYFRSMGKKKVMSLFCFVVVSFRPHTPKTLDPINTNFTIYPSTIYNIITMTPAPHHHLRLASLVIVLMVLASVATSSKPDDSPSSSSSPNIHNTPPTTANIIFGILVFLGASAVAVLGLGYGCFVLSGTRGGGILGAWLSRVPGYTEVPSSVEEGEMDGRTY